MLYVYFSSVRHVANRGNGRNISNCSWRGHWPHSAMLRQHRARRRCRDYGNQAITIFERYKKSTTQPPFALYDGLYSSLPASACRSTANLSGSALTYSSRQAMMGCSSPPLPANVLARQSAYAQAEEYFRQCIRKTERLGLTADKAEI